MESKEYLDPSHIPPDPRDEPISIDRFYEEPAYIPPDPGSHYVYHEKPSLIKRIFIGVIYCRRGIPGSLVKQHGSSSMDNYYCI